MSTRSSARRNRQSQSQWTFPTHASRRDSTQTLEALRSNAESNPSIVEVAPAFERASRPAPPLGSVGAHRGWRSLSAGTPKRWKHAAGRQLPRGSGHPSGSRCHTKRKASLPPPASGAHRDDDHTSVTMTIAGSEASNKQLTNSCLHPMTEALCACLCVRLQHETAGSERQKKKKEEEKSRSSSSGGGGGGGGSGRGRTGARGRAPARGKARWLLPASQPVVCTTMCSYTESRS
jgi:hypothetical protein